MTESPARAGLQRSASRNKSYVDLAVDSDDDDIAMSPLQPSKHLNKGEKRKRVGGFELQIRVVVLRSGLADLRRIPHLRLHLRQTKMKKSSSWVMRRTKSNTSSTRAYGASTASPRSSTSSTGSDIPSPTGRGRFRPSSRMTIRPLSRSTRRTPLSLRRETRCLAAGISEASSVAVRQERRTSSNQRQAAYGNLQERRGRA